MRSEPGPPIAPLTQQPHLTPPLLLCHRGSSITAPRGAPAFYLLAALPSMLQRRSMALTPEKRVTKFMSSTYGHLLTLLMMKALLIDWLLPGRFVSGPDPILAWVARAQRYAKLVLTGLDELDRADEMLLHVFVAVLSGYLLMGVVCLAMDLLLPVKTRIAMKAQGEGSRPFTLREWMDAFSLSMRNVFLVGIPLFLPLFYLPLRRGESWYDSYCQRWCEPQQGSAGAMRAVASEFRAGSNSIVRGSSSMCWCTWPSWRRSSTGLIG